MMEFNMRKPLLNMTVHPRPFYGLAVATPFESEPPALCDLEAETQQRVRVVRHPVVMIVPANNGSEPFPLFGDRLMHSLSHLGADLLKFHFHFLPYRSPKN